jgi:4-methyl-5(b-hydroxyethyl)-thiazole monophosphate biosynthesis
MVYILLGEGFEEIEAVAPCDILRRGGVQVCFAGVDHRQVTGSHGIVVTADCLVHDIQLDQAEMIVLPGGLGGVQSMLASEKAMQLVRDAYDRGLWVAAICAAPTILAKLGILNGKKAVCYPGMENECIGAQMMQESATVQDGKVITGRGPGAALEFGYRILAALRNPDTSANVRCQMCSQK